MRQRIISETPRSWMSRPQESGVQLRQKSHCPSSRQRGRCCQLSSSQRHKHLPDRQHDTLQRGDKPPFALDMFSGENAPMAYALLWRGWRVGPVDWLLNAPHDLSKPEVQRGVAFQVQSCDAAIWAVDCSTFSRAREMAIPGHHAAPRPLRAENEVRGLRTLEGRDAARVEQANLFIDFTFAQIAQSVSAGKAAILESPARSHLCGFQQLRDIRKLPEWRRTLYNACC